MSVPLTDADEAGYGYGYQSSSVSEIQEEGSDLFELTHGVSMPIIKEEYEGSEFSLDREYDVYVAVGRSESSMDALSWTLRHAVNPSTVVHLIHVFPEIRHIPSPLGKLPTSQVSPEQVEMYMAQESRKRRELLQKFLNACSASKVKAETILIESDIVAKAILDLIPILNIKKLVLGASKSTVRKLRSRRGSGISEQILQGALETCEVKIISEGKELTIEQMIGSPSPRCSDGSSNSTPMQEQAQPNDSFVCICFKPKCS